ncbi:MAG: Hsp20/alpha crystallin family protein [bacterium]
MFNLISFKHDDYLNPLSIDKKVDSLFKEMMMFSPSSFFNIVTDVKENDKEYIIQAELPGLKKQDINVEFNRNHLIIEAYYKDNEKEEKNKFLYSERRKGSFKKTFHIENVKVDKIKGDYKNGILEIVLPKEKPDTPTKKIEIN